MNNKILTIVIFLFLVVTVLFTIVKYTVNGNGTLISPVVRKVFNLPTAVSLSTPIPQTPSYNPPAEIKYDSSTDLKKELDSVDPKVLDEDFQELNN